MRLAPVSVFVLVLVAPAPGLARAEATGGPAGAWSHISDWPAPTTGPGRLVYDTSRQHALLVVNQSSEVWQLNPTAPPTWTPLTITAPVSIGYTGYHYDPSHDRLLTVSVAQSGLQIYEMPLSGPLQWSLIPG